MATGIPVVSASTLSTLAEQKDLNPESLIRSFADFAFELNAQRQEPETFLRRKRGDCDDFASLASRLLTARGYKTKLVLVMMQEQTHVVCYVQEARGFLDFNHRADARPIIEADGTLEGIAEKVAADFRSKWHLASEFRYENGLPIYLENVFPFAAAKAAPTVPAIKSTTSRTNELSSVQSPSPTPLAAPAIAGTSDLRLP